MHFLEWKYINFDLDFTYVYSQGGLINNIPALIQIMAWCRPGDKPLSEPGAKPLSEPMISIYRRICASLGLNELMTTKQVLQDKQIFSKYNSIDVVGLIHALFGIAILNMAASAAAIKPVKQQWLVTFVIDDFICFSLAFTLIPIFIV